MTVLNIDILIHVAIEKMNMKGGPGVDSHSVQKEKKAGIAITKNSPNAKGNTF